MWYRISSSKQSHGLGVITRGVAWRLASRGIATGNIHHGYTVSSPWNQIRQIWTFMVRNAHLCRYTTYIWNSMKITMVICTMLYPAHALWQGISNRANSICWAARGFDSHVETADCKFNQVLFLVSQHVIQCCAASPIAIFLRISWTRRCISGKAWICSERSAVAQGSTTKMRESFASAVETRRQTAGEPGVELTTLFTSNCFVETLCQLLLLARAMHVAGGHAFGASQKPPLAELSVIHKFLEYTYAILGYLYECTNGQLWGVHSVWTWCLCEASILPNLSRCHKL